MRDHSACGPARSGRVSGTERQARSGRASGTLLLVPVHQALYRKHRPQTFAEVVGQGHVTETLASEVVADRIAHAYLFAGPRGTGKTTTARILAKAINCEAGPTATPCNTCRQCTEITDGSSVDVIELDMASHGGVDDARELRDRALFAPASARRKIYILDEVHMASTAAFNALLKMIEEPPEHVMFAMATTDPQKVLPTIMSRVQRLDLRRVSAAAVAGNVRALCEAEGYRIEDGAVEAIVRAGDGSLRDTQSVLEQVLAYAGTEVTADAVQQVLGATPTEKVAEVVDRLAARDVAGLLAGVQRLVDDGHDLRRFTLDLVGHVRDLLVLGAAPEHPDLVDATDERRRLLQEQATALPADTLLRAVRVLSATVTEQRLGSPRLPLELALATLVVPSERAQIDELTDRLARLEAGTFPAPASATPQTPPPVRESPPAAESQPARRSAAVAAASLDPEPEAAERDAEQVGADTPPSADDEPSQVAGDDAAPLVAEPADSASGSEVDEPGPDLVAEGGPPTPEDGIDAATVDAGQRDEPASDATTARASAEAVAVTTGSGGRDADADADTAEVPDAGSAAGAAGVTGAGEDAGVDGAVGAATTDREAADAGPEVAGDEEGSDVTSDATGDELALIEQRWDAILDAVREGSRRHHAVFVPAKPVRAGRGILTLRYGRRYASFHAANAGGGDYATAMQQAIERVCGLRMRLEISVEGDDDRRRPLPPSLTPDDARTAVLHGDEAPEGTGAAGAAGSDRADAGGHGEAADRGGAVDHQGVDHPGADHQGADDPAAPRSMPSVSGDDNADEHDEEIDVREAEATAATTSDPEQVGRLLADELGAELVDERRPPSD